VQVSDYSCLILAGIDFFKVTALINWSVNSAEGSETMQRQITALHVRDVSSVKSTL
jgi:hypothetical protein